MKKTREEMTKSILNALKANDCPYEIENTTESNIIRVNVRLDCFVAYGKLVIIVDDYFPKSIFHIFNNARKRIPEVSEFLMRANNIDDIGCFSLDCDEGDISYEFSYPNVYKQDEDLAILWLLPMKRFEDYGDGLLKVMLGCSTPKEAFEECIRKISEQDTDNF